MVLGFTISNEYNAYADYILLKIRDKIYFITSYNSSCIKNLLLDEKEEVVYFGEHVELLRFINFGFSEKYNYYDLLHRIWNLDTSKTEIDLESCFKFCLGIVLENKSMFSFTEEYIRKLNLIASKHNDLTKLKKEIQIISNSIEFNSDKNIIELNYDNDFTENIKVIFDVMKFVYKFSQEYQFTTYSDLLDDELCSSLVELERNKIKLDYNYLRNIRVQLNDRLSELLSAIYIISKKKFNINSPKELNYILKDIGVLNNRISNTELQNNYDQTGLSVFHYIDLYRKINMCLEQYIKPLYESAIKNKFGRFKYNTCKVPCLTQGHYCIEQTKGIVDISDIRIGDFIWTEYGFKKVIRANCYLSNEIIKVDLSNGVFIKGTKHHPILVNVANNNIKHSYHKIEQRWVALDELFVGESVICNHNYSDLLHSSNEYIKNIQKNTAAFLCELFCKNAYLINGYICLKNIRFSNVVTFPKFKIYCELSGLKHWSFCSNKEYNTYDIVFYDGESINRLFNKYKSQLTDRVIKLIREYLETPQSFSFEKTTDKQQGYFNLQYEETIVLSIEKQQKEELVYDIEVEDVHQYNANTIIHHNTGRLSSSKSSSKNDFYTNLNIQSVPKNVVNDINIRKSFLPEEDCYWCCIDYKSQEMRLASCLYGVEKIKSIPEQEDIYESIGKQFNIFDKSNLSKQTIRSGLKIISLGMIYGLSNEGIYRQLKSIGIEDDFNSKDYRKEFYDVYPELREGQLKTLKYAHAVHGIYTLSGRFRKIDFSLYDIENLLTRNNRIAWNTIIQGTCGDIIRILINNVEKTLVPVYSKYGFRLLSTIHDEINVSIPKEESLFKEILSKLIPLVKTPIKQRSDITFGCSLSIGNNWGSLQKHENLCDLGV